MKPMTLALILVGAVTAGGQRARAGEPLPDGRLGYRTAPILLLSRPDVRADLRLDAKQAEAAERELTALYVRAAGLKGKTGPAADAARRQIDADHQRWLETHLRPEQHARLLQIDLQWEGPSALVSRPVLTDRLGLTRQQMDELRQAVAKRDRERASGRYDSAVEARLARAALAILSEDQRHHWRGLLGPPFQPRLATTPANPKR